MRHVSPRMEERQITTTKIGFQQMQKISQKYHLYRRSLVSGMFFIVCSVLEISSESADFVFILKDPPSPLFAVRKN